MIWKAVTGLRLALSFAAGLALFGMQSASAGLLLTVDALTNFQFDDAQQVVYDPGLGNLTIRSRGDFQIAPQSSGASGTSDEDALYLNAEPTGEDGWMVSILKDLNSTSEASTSALLKGSLDDMRADRRLGAFDFLVKEGTVSGTFASQFGGSGVYVRVAGLDDTKWMAISESLNQLSAERANARLSVAQSGGGPTIPVPGTIALLLFAGVPLLASRRRR